MDPRIIPLYYVSSLAGLIMTAGGIWLLYKQKIYIDRESKQITEIETPIGKFKTNIPALALFALGFVPLIYPIVKSAGTIQQVQIKGKVKSTVFPVQVYVAIESDSLLQNREFALAAPILTTPPEKCKVIYVAGTTVSEDLVELGNKQEGEFRLPDKEISPAAVAAFEANVPPRPADFR